MPKFFNKEKTLEEKCTELCEKLAKRHHVPSNIVSNIMNETTTFVKNEVLGT